MPQGDQFFDCGKLAGMFDRQGLKRTLTAMRNDGFRETVRLVQQHERIVAQVGQGNVLFVGQFVAGGQHEQQLFVEERFDFVVLLPNRRGDNRDINFALVAPLQQLICRLFKDHDIHERMLIAKVSQHGGKKVGSDGWDGPHSNPTAFSVVGQFGQSVIDQRQNLLRPCLKQAPGIRERDVSSLSLENRLAEFFL